MNYRNLMDDVLAGLADTPTLLLHSCCAPCSTAAIAALSSRFRITVFYYNPNIDERAEYERRKAEQQRLLSVMETPNPVAFLEGDWRPEDFLAFAAPLAGEKEGGRRCEACFGLRLGETARRAREGGFDYFTTTLTVGPMKDAERINSIGSALAGNCGVRWLWSDFKKKDGYRLSIELSRKYGLYRQDYCGCSFSRQKKPDPVPDPA